VTGKSATVLSLLNVISRADLTFGWFVNPLVATGILISKLLRKKSIVVVGGGDIDRMPEIDYGGGL
jgi:hypothetical protein